MTTAMIGGRTAAVHTLFKRGTSFHRKITEFLGPSAEASLREETFSIT